MGGIETATGDQSHLGGGQGCSRQDPARQRPAPAPLALPCVPHMGNLPPQKSAPPITSPTKSSWALA